MIDKVESASLFFKTKTVNYVRNFEVMAMIGLRVEGVGGECGRKGAWHRCALCVCLLLLNWITFD